MGSRLAPWDIWALLLILPGLTGSHLAAQSIRLNLDLTDAPRNIYHAH